METWFTDLNSVEMFYLICALLGGTFFVVRLILQIVGLADHDVADFDSDIGDSGHADADSSFKLLTLHGLTSFLLMFGLVGFALYRQSRVGAALSIFGAAGAGMGSVWIIGKMFNTVGKLQSSGTVNTVGAVGAEGEVYLTIPKEGTGRVMINFKNRLREFDAVSQDKEELKTGTRIRVSWVKGNVLQVEKI